jgi:hypothetical protein
MVDYAASMNSDEPEPPTPTDATSSSQSDQERFPHLVLDKEADEDDQEGDTTLTFISPPSASPPDNDE